eukprot:Lithocolla_globosa_v1_NODE_5544_length_1222_cov_2.972579.p2 type:complete len:100 gc:universal NODE_5544_length_1222_cov_2.972579:911-612(-)
MQRLTVVSAIPRITESMEYQPSSFSFAAFAKQQRNIDNPVESIAITQRTRFFFSNHLFSCSSRQSDMWSDRRFQKRTIQQTDRQESISSNINVNHHGMI